MTFLKTTRLLKEGCSLKTPQKMQPSCFLSDLMYPRRHGVKLVSNPSSPVDEALQFAPGLEMGDLLGFDEDLVARFRIARLVRFSLFHLE